MSVQGSSRVNGKDKCLQQAYSILFQFVASNLCTLLAMVIPPSYSLTNAYYTWVTNSTEKTNKDCNRKRDSDFLIVLTL